MLAKAADDAHDARVAADAGWRQFWVVLVWMVDIVALYPPHVELSQRIKKH